MVSSYTHSNTNYLFNGCDILTFIHNSTGTKLSLSKASNEKQVVEIFTRFLEETEVNQLNTFVYNPIIQKAVVVEFGVKDKKGFNKPKFLFVCLGPERQLPTSKEISCLEPRSANPSIVIKQSDTLFIYGIQSSAQAESYRFSKKPSMDREVQLEIQRRGDISSHQRTITTSLKDTPWEPLNSETNVDTNILSRETRDRMAGLIQERIKELFRIALTQATGSPA